MVGEKPGYQNDATQMDGSNPARHTEREVRNVSARRGFRLTNQGDRTPLFHLRYRSLITDY
jgi:hypothetical protein